MSDWNDLVHGERWRSADTLWVEDGTAHSWAEVSDLAAGIEKAIGGARVVVIRSTSRLGCFAGQLAAWRAGSVAVPDDGNLGPAEFGLVRPDVVINVEPVVTAVPEPGGADLPDDVMAVNFTSGSTGSRKAVAVTRANLLALFTDRGLDIPIQGVREVAAGFAAPAYDGWWFDTWRTAWAGGTIVRLPSVNEDVFAWADLTGEYGIDRVLLPAAVLATLVSAVPDAVAGIPWVFSGGEAFHPATYRQARSVGLTGRFVNLYGPTEATFATHRFDLPDGFDAATIPIGRPLHDVGQELRDTGDGRHELMVSGPGVCLGYLSGGTLTRRFDGSYATGDLVRLDEDGNVVYVGRRDSQIKVNGVRVDAADLAGRVTALPGVLDCRIVQDDAGTVAFVRTGGAVDAASRTPIEAVVLEFSPAIAVHLTDRFPTKAGGKVDTAALINDYRIARDREVAR